MDFGVRVACNQNRALHGVFKLQGQLTMPPPRPTGTTDAIHSYAGMVHETAPT